MPVSVSLVIDSLQAIADGYKAQGVVHKAKAYRTAIDSIKDRFGTDGTIEAVADLTQLKGVGKAMLEKVQEMMKTQATLKQADAVRSDPVTQALELYTSVHGIGPVLANRLVREMGLRTIEDLRRIAKDNPSVLPEKVHLGLKHYTDTSEKIPFDEVERFAQRVDELCRTRIDPRLRAVCCGSHRRLKPQSGDVDLLITHPLTHSSSEYAYLDRLVKLLKEEGLVLEDTLASGVHKFMGFGRVDENSPVRRIDIKFFPADQFFSALLYFTGSDKFNIRCRQAAIEKGLRLNEYGLWTEQKQQDEGENSNDHSEGKRRGRSNNDDDDNELDDDDLSGPPPPANTAAAKNPAPPSPNAKTTTATKAKATDGMSLVVVPTCEQDLFRALGLPYLKPSERTH